jgi:hypothetical protein
VSDGSTTEATLPTADEYHHAAGELRRLAGRLNDGGRVLDAAIDLDRIAGGRVAAAVRGALDSVRAARERAEVELVRLAEICERRAAICADHAAALRRHHRLAALDPSSSPPARPAHWVEP